MIYQGVYVWSQHDSLLESPVGRQEEQVSPKKKLHQ